MATRVATATAPERLQRIRFSRGGDGVRIAYASHGQGPPLIVVSCWLSHLQYDWSSPVWRHFLDDLGEFTTLIRYDERGFGLSDWTVEDFSLDARLSDLEVLVDALDLERFSMMGMSGGGPVAMAYAARHGDRVDRLMLYGASAVGRQTTEPTERELAFRAMIRAGWAQEDPLFRRVFTNMFIPDATEQQMGWYDELQRMSTSTDNAVASRLARQEVDVTDALPAITAPTLVLHARQDAAVPFENAVQSAGLIPRARLVPLESRNHILLADEPAWPVFVEEVRRFVSGSSAVATDAVTTLSRREREILELAAGGLPNGAIAERLVLSPRTVERHLSNAYLKLGVSGPAARAAAVASLLRQPAP